MDEVLKEYPRAAALLNAEKSNKTELQRLLGLLEHGLRAANRRNEVVEIEYKVTVDPYESHIVTGGKYTPKPGTIKEENETYGYDDVLPLFEHDNIGETSDEEFAEEVREILENAQAKKEIREATVND